jgi:hypothetical protein
MGDVKIDLDAANPLVDAEPKTVEDVKVVFVPFEDGEMRVNQTTTRYQKGRAIKLSHDEARILLDAEKGYIKD